MSSRIVKAKRAKPLDPSRRMRIEQALGTGDVEGAAKLAEAALAAGQTDVLVLNLAAWRREEAGDFRGAHRLLERALAIAPGDVMIEGSLGAVLRKEGRYAESLAVLDRVVTAEPRHGAAWLERGYTLEALREEKLASQSYANALAVEPNLAPALGKLADIGARRGEKEAGREYARRALQLDPTQPSAIFALATMANEEGRPEEAVERLEELLTTPLRGEDRTRSLTLLGDAFDKLDRTADAFAAWERAQASFRQTYGPLIAPTTGRPSHRRFIEEITRWLMAKPTVMPVVEDVAVAGEAAVHVFLLGYPRSGTTLVENILASAPEVVALEERDTLVDADEALVPNDGAMRDLSTLDSALVVRLREQYWKRVRTMAGEDVAGKVFVDMNPLNGIKLPVIARLFPRARILVMRRDPRDVVLSCYRINFTPSPASWAFSDLEETARHYDALTGLVEIARERLPLAFHDVRYDKLVSDFENEVRSMAEFIGLAWTDSFRAFDRTAKTRGVRTASATQVRRGLYDGGGKWRRYEAQLAPALPFLAPWVERFGFTA